MSISALMEKEILRIDEDSTVQRAAELMGKHHVGSLLVTRNNQDVGIITERDIMSKVLAEKHSLDDIKVKNVMSQPLITVDSTTEGEQVIKIMDQKKIRRVFVTDQNQIVGVFSTSDIRKLARLSP